MIVTDWVLVSFKLSNGETVEVNKENLEEFLKTHTDDSLGFRNFLVKQIIKNLRVLGMKKFIYEREDN